MLLVVSRQTFLWALLLVTVESEVVIGRATATCSVTHTPSLWSQTTSSLTRVQTQCLVLLNKERIKSLCHLIALFWSGCCPYYIHKDTHTRVSPGFCTQSIKSSHFSFVATWLLYPLCCETKPAEINFSKRHSTLSSYW